MSSRIEFITRGVKIMAKRITKRPANRKTCNSKRAITKKTLIQIIKELQRLKLHLIGKNLKKQVKKRFKNL